MIYPSLADVVHTISKSLDEVIAPQLTSVRERSTLTTARHLLRFVANAIDTDGQVMFDELQRLRTVLAHAATGFQEVEALRPLAANIRQALAHERDPAVYPSFKILAADIGALRQLATDSLIAIRGLPATHRDAAIDDIHRQIRDYIRWQIEQETRVFEPAFLGYGARR